MNKSKSLVIKTDSNVIYVVNGKVSCVRCAATGRFVAVKKFANIVNNLIVKAKNVNEAKKLTMIFITMLQLSLQCAVLKTWLKWQRLYLVMS